MAHGCSLFSLLSPHISQYVNVGEIFVNQFSFISSFDMPWSGCCGLCLGPHLQHGGTLFHRHGEGGWLLALGSLIQGTSFFIHALAKMAAWIERLMWVPFHPFGLQLASQVLVCPTSPTSPPSSLLITCPTDFRLQCQTDAVALHKLCSQCPQEHKVRSLQYIKNLIHLCIPPSTYSS